MLRICAALVCATVLWIVVVTIVRDDNAKHPELLSLSPGHSRYGLFRRYFARGSCYGNLGGLHSLR